MDDKVSERERRLVLRVLGRWDEHRAGRPFPARRDIAAELAGEDGPSAFVLELAAPEDPLFAFIGEALRRAHGGAAWRRVSECPEGTLLRHATGFLPQVLERRIPVSIGGAGRHDERDILFRAILLPLSDDGSRIDAVLGAANCRAVAHGRT